MDYHPFKAAVNRFFAGYVGGDQRPVFFDIDATLPQLNIVTEAFPKIRDEFERIYTAGLSMPRYHDIDPGEKEISAKVDADRNWNVLMLYLLGNKPKQNRALCPETCRALEGVPNLMQAFFSILDPGKSVPLHEGPYLGYLRYHLPLHVPRDNPPSIIVNGRRHVWKEGEAVLFDDSWPHEVVNTADDYRAVLIVDVYRPMPLVPSLVNRGVLHGVIRPTYGRSVMRRISQSGRGQTRSEFQT